MCKAYCKIVIGKNKGKEKDGTSLGQQREIEIRDKSVTRLPAPCTSPPQSSSYSY